ncbi:MAG: hypothetical protein ACYCZW_01970 [Minisyncoccota bacterium]
MISRFNTLIIICVLFLSFYFPSLGKAQLIGITENDVAIGVYPESPKPNEPVTVTIETYSFDLDSSNTKWYVNDNLAQEGKGIKTLTFQARSLGQSSTVKIVIDSNKGQIIKNINITPNIVSILWEADTYTPPFFKGKTLFSHQSTVTFVAQPQIIVGGKTISATNLIYKWSKDGTILGNQNGYGKQTLTLDGSVISRTMRIFVEVEDPQSGAIASGVISLNPVEPEILTYVVDPLYGVQYNKAIKGTLGLPSKEITLMAVPYFFSIKNSSYNPEISYNWSINGNTILDGLNTNTRVFRKVGDVFGTSNIGLRILNDNKLLQFASYNMLIDFKKETVTGNQPF